MADLSLTIVDEAVEEAARDLALRVNPLVQVPYRSTHDTRRLRAVVETRGWDIAQRQYPEVARILGELRAGLVELQDGESHA